ncbi:MULTISPECIES: sterol desaturase family protein [Bradyrhizobium]|uniref:sterol desaturase family protein n=1 Tax=Bradyrhizobium TaxID=374 RepID=UPI0021677566|nr:MULTISPECIES: sterol desaturase family protein [Bradyrhizobium]
MHIVDGIFSNAEIVVGAGLFCWLLEMALPGETQSVASRLRGALMWCVYIVTSVSTYIAADDLIGLGRVTPVLSIDLTQAAASSNWLGVAVGYAILPFVPFIIVDFFYYWFHRLQHALPLLWRIHKVHHSIKELNGFNSYHHVVEELVRIPLMIVPMAFLIRVEVPHVVVVTTLLSFSGIIIHANTKASFGLVRYVLVEPRFHRIHHSIEERHWGRNFSAFCSLWDVIFRTAYFPDSDEFPKTGVAGVAEPSGLQEFLIAPMTPSSSAAISTPAAPSTKVPQ